MSSRGRYSPAERKDNTAQMVKGRWGDTQTTDATEGAIKPPILAKMFTVAIAILLKNRESGDVVAAKKKNLRHYK